MEKERGKRRKDPKMQIKDTSEGQNIEIQAILSDHKIPGDYIPTCSTKIFLPPFISHLILAGKWVGLPCTQQGQPWEEVGRNKPMAKVRREWGWKAAKIPSPYASPFSQHWNLSLLF